MKATSPLCSPCILIIALVLGATVLAGCGSESGDDPRASYTGVWDVRFNFSENGCGLVAAGLPGFIDRHTLDEVGSQVTLQSSAGIIPTTSADLSAEDSFVAVATVEGDLFEDGSLCVLRSQISYGREQEDRERASALFAQTISCNDGFTCQSRAVGSASRLEAVVEAP